MSPAALGAFLSWENEQASAKLLPSVLFQLGTVAFDRLHLITVGRWASHSKEPYT